MLKRVRRLLADGNVIYECRDCGTTHEPRTEDCGVCGSTDIVRYTIE
jgi:rubrerythrin